MKMYHPDAELPIIVHPTSVELMLSRGWTVDEPTKAKPKRKAKDAIETTQEIDNGES